VFIQNFAENNALAMPGRLCNYKNADLKLLPSSMTKKYVYDLYCAAHTHEHATVAELPVHTSCEPMSLRLWYITWNDLCRNVVAQLPRSDLCALCQQNQTTVGKMRNLDEDKKLDLIGKCQEHLVTVQKERELYSTLITSCNARSMLPIEPGK